MKNTKKFTSILLTLAMVISMMTMFASAANTVDSGDIGAARETKQNDPLVSSTAIGDIMTYDTDDPGSYTDTVRWMLDSDGVLTISGTGPTARFDSSYCPYLDRPAAGYNSPVAYNNNVKTVIIEESITDFDTDFISQYHQVSGESTMSGIETIIFMSASTHFNLNTERLPNLKNVLIGANLKDDAFDWTSTGVRHGMDASKFSGETLLLTKHGNGYSNNLVIRSDSDFALTDLDFYFGRDKTLNITQISFAEMLTHAQAALTDVPASVLTKLPAALRPAGAVNTPPQNISVTFNANGGTVGTAAKTVTVGKLYGTLPVPTRTGYTFDGWYTAASGGQLIAASSLVSAASDHTLYAHWTKAREDTFRFNNSSPNFNSTYRISDGAFSFLTEGETAARAAYLRNLEQTSWWGSCFGMSTVYALSHSGEIHVSHFQDDAYLLYDLKTPRTSASVNDLINFYHLIQCDGYVGSLRSSALRYSQPGQEESNLRTLIQRLDASGGYVVLCISYMSGPTIRASGHAVVAVDYTQGSDGSYAVRIWDPNYPDTFNTLTIASDFGDYYFAAPLTYWDTFIGCALLPDEVNHKDLERYAVSGAGGGQTVSDYSTLVISDGSFRVDCSDGSYAVFKNGVQTAGSLILTDVSPVGAGSSGERSYAFPASANAVITVTPSSADQQQIALLTEDTYASVEAADISKLRFSGDSVTTDCASAAQQEIVLVSDALGDTWNSATLTGADTGFSLKAAKGAVEISSNNPVTATVTGGNAHTGKSSVKQRVESTRNGVTVSVADMRPAVNLNFKDVPATAYYYDAVRWAVENGITKGTTETTFSPDVTCSNAHILTFLWRAYGSPVVNTANSFTDVTEGAYYYQAAQWAKSMGMVSGDKFAPNAPCSRASSVMFMWKAAGSPTVTTKTNFTDIPANADYAMAVAWALENGVTKGTTDTTFSPDRTCTRAQIATFLYRGLEL